MLKVGRMNESANSKSETIEFKGVSYEITKKQAEYRDDYNITITNTKTKKSVTYEDIPKAEFDSMKDNSKIQAFIKYNDKLSESVSMNESAKIIKMTKAMGQGYSGEWQLPSGNPGLVANTEEFELVVLGTEEDIQIMLQNNDGDLWFKDYPVTKEKEAVADFKKMVPYLNDLMDAGKFARKFGLTIM